MNEVHMNSQSQQESKGSSADQHGPTEKLPQELDDSTTAVKRSQIKAACQTLDIQTLAQLASSKGGLIDDETRRLAWPILLGSELNESDLEEERHWLEEPAHRDEEQVQLDVNRAFVYYPNDQSQQQIDENKRSLSRVIKQTLRQHRSLCYFQGYHDIIQVLLLVLGEPLAPHAAARLSLLRIRDFMLPSLSPAMKHITLIPAVLERADPALCRYLSGTKPFFALPATLTLYAHDIQEYVDIARLFDFLLSHEPVMAIYFFVAIVLSRRKELLEIPPDEPEMLHFTLQKLPRSLDLDDLIKSALELYRQFPPENLPRRAWYNISSSSVLKTSRNILEPQSLEQGEKLLLEHEKQLRREEQLQEIHRLLRKYQKPAVSIAIPIVVGITAFWFRRSGNDKVFWSYLRHSVH